MTLEVAIQHRQGSFTLDAQFSVDEPGVTALFGPSGAGKSSIVQAIAGLLRPERGRIVIDDDVVFDSRTGRNVPAWRRRLGYVFQDDRLFPHLSVRDNLLFGARRSRGGRRAAAFDDVVATLGIGALLGRRPSALSGGERQRVALGRALLARPRMLLLDEPLSALDQARKAEIMPFLTQLRDAARVPMVYVTHALDEFTRLADTIVLLDRGAVRAAVPVVEAMARLDLLPFAGAGGAGALIVARVVDHDPADALTELAFAGGRLWVPAISVRKGDRVRVRIAARDVILASSAPNETSINNILEGKIEAISEESGALAHVRLVVGETALLARITRRSLRRLALVEGGVGYALIKAVSVHGHDLDDQRTGDLL